jgi:hypothetical protein
MNNWMDVCAIMLGPVWVMAPSLPDPTMLLSLAGTGAIIWKIRRREKRQARDGVIRIKLAGHHAASSVVSIRGRLVIAANSVAQPLGQGDREEPPGPEAISKSRLTGHS